MSQYKYKIVGDTHVDEDSFVETEHIFTEIEKIEANELIFLGDVFHQNNPTPREINFVLKWFKRFKEKHQTVTVILGNHDLYAGFQTTSLLKYIGIEVKPACVVPMVTSVGSFLLGHFFVVESKDNYSDTQLSIASYSKDYKYVLLGHQHRFQELTYNAWHIGSTRYVAFNEYDIPLTTKKIGLIDFQGALTFKELKSPYPLKQFSSVDELYAYYQNRIIDNVIYDKIRLKYLDFDTYKKDINRLDNILIPLHHQIKIKLDFVNNQVVRAYDTELKKGQITVEEVVKKWLDSIQDKDVQKILQQESSDLCD